jgi:hypothetical protein
MPAFAMMIPAIRTTMSCLFTLIVCIVMAGPMAIPGASQGSAAGEEGIDFVRFDGAVYLSSAYLAQGGEATGYRPLDASDLGPIVGRVERAQTDPTDEAAFPNEPCFWDLSDGTAPRLLAGDPIYAVQGFATTFRLAAVRDDEVVLYQVWCSDDAWVGADLFDIYGRVERISVTGDLSEASGFAAIEDPGTLDVLTTMLLAGRVIPEELASDAPVAYQLIFHLDDGTTFRASTADGEFLWGLSVIEIPPAFEEALARAWNR